MCNYTFVWFTKSGSVKIYTLDGSMFDDWIHIFEDDIVNAYKLNNSTVFEINHFKYSLGV